jgi:hypothetical protein
MPIGRFEIPESIVPNGRGLASITIDDDDCLNTFAYIPDWMNSALLVFSASQGKVWRFNHNFFFFNPFEGTIILAEHVPSQSYSNASILLPFQ